MATPNETFKQYGQLPFYYFNGLLITNDATTPNTLLDISAGSCLDSTATFQINVTTPIVINSATVGLNGIDTGAIAASSVYGVFLVGDPVNQSKPGAVISLAATPQIPGGYQVFALIGYVVTDSSKNFLKGYWSDSDSPRRTFTFDAPIICLSGGTSNTYVGVALTTFVPAINNTSVVLFSNWTANAAADVLNYQGYNSTGDAITVIAPVAGATAHTTSQNTVLAQLNSGAPSIKYKVSAGTLSTYVCSYTYDL